MSKFLLNNRSRPGIVARRALGVERRNNYPLIGQPVSPIESIMTANGPISQMPGTIKVTVSKAFLPKTKKQKFPRTLSPLTKTRRHRRSKN